MIFEDYEQSEIASFMEKAGQKVNSQYTEPTKEDLLLRFKLITEEFQEFLASLGIKYQDVPSEKSDLYNFNPDVQLNEVELIDALVDLIYVIKGTFVLLGLDVSIFFDEVHNSNMSKFIDGAIDPKTGKFIKGPSYRKADLAKILQEQKNNKSNT